MNTESRGENAGSVYVRLAACPPLPCSSSHTFSGFSTVRAKPIVRPSTVQRASPLSCASCVGKNSALR
jgi:hypothetical protein